MSEAPGPRRPPEAGAGEPCDRCGAPTEERHCKLVCPRCGATRDCSDP